MSIDARPQGTGCSWQVHLLHWLTVLLLLPKLVIAMLWMGRGTGSVEWLAAHVSLGVLVLVRISVRLFVQSVRRLGRFAAALQVLLYVDLLAVSATG